MPALDAPREPDIYPEADRPAVALSPRTFLDDKYRLGRVLGHGGFGLTYLAWDVALHAPVAIKEYLPRDLATRAPNGRTVTPHATGEDETFGYGLDQFLSEARTLAQFDHPNVVRVRSFFEAHGTAYLVMDYYPGRTLATYLDEQGGTLPASRALKILLPVLDGLNAVHERGLIHRDLKPQNVYLADSGRVVLLDFGTARQATAAHSRSLSVQLTPGYAPFEQYSSRGTQGPWTDVYAASATLYRMVTGTAPPEAPALVMGEITLTPPSSFGVPPNLSHAIEAGMAVMPDDRIRTADALEQALTGDRPDNDVPNDDVSTDDVPHAPDDDAANGRRDDALDDDPEGAERPVPLSVRAGFWRRAGAFAIDLGIVAVLTALVGGVMGGVHGVTTNGASFSAAFQALLNGLGGLLTWLYFAGLESSPRRATFGKRALDLQVTDSNGERIGFGRATARHVARLLSALPLFIGYLMVGVTRRKQALHDLIAGCVVVHEKGRGTSPSSYSGRRAVAVGGIALLLLGAAVTVAVMLTKTTPDEHAAAGHAAEVRGDWTTALASYRAAGPDHPEGAAGRADAHFYGTTGTIDYRSAVVEARRAAEGGSARGQYRFGVLHLYGWGIDRDEDEAERWFRRSLSGLRLAAETGDAIAQRNLAFLYAQGRGGVEKDEETAVRWYRAGARQGFAGAQAGLGDMYQYGYGVSADAGEAVRWYRAAAQQGLAGAQHRLAGMYQDGVGVSVDEGEAARWYRAAAEQGLATAQNHLAVMYENGTGVAADIAEAARWYRRAADQGHMYAQKNLGALYEDGRGVPKDVIAAVRWYRAAAEQGLASGQYNLGTMYWHGRGVSKNVDTALRWYRQAAEQGLSSAQFALGLICANGNGVPTNFQTAREWYRKAAEQGHSSAQNNLGVLYWNGEGGSQNKSTALKWYRKAAAQGLEKAHSNLDAAYRSFLSGLWRTSDGTLYYYRATTFVERSSRRNSVGTWTITDSILEHTVNGQTTRFSILTMSATQYTLKNVRTGTLIKATAL